MTSSPPDVAGRVQAVRERIAEAALRAGRDPAAITLVAASKTQPPERIAEVVRAGVRDVGENRVQEARSKIPAVSAALHGLPGPTWHLIGHVQTNKAAAAADLFQVVQSVDSVRVAEALSRRATRPLAVLLEVYVGDDPDRPGLRPAELSEAAGRIIELPHLNVRGLMSVAPLGLAAAEVRAAFAAIRNLRDSLAVEYPRVHWTDVSMGMTEDFPVAIAEGSTMVRVGRAIFGERTLVEPA
ncbi:MAG: YggS family pyridoxal phosphate-dependent enzyme [Chloroflexi bacterium]|nr:YggS family pyridoxal phosphate-dependent enzyme [Chloroflexota bacterium]